MQRADIIIDFIIKNNFKKMVEVGVWKGETARYILASEAGTILDEYWGIDPYKTLNPCRENVETEYGKMALKTQGEWDQMYKKTCKLLLFFPKLRLLKLPSFKVASMIKSCLANSPYFDLVFIDADHYYEDVKIDLEAWYSLVKGGGIICGHDYEARWHPGVKKAVDEFFGEKNIELYPDQVWVVNKKKE